MGWHYGQEEQDGDVGANNEGKSGDTTANPQDRAEQRQPHITCAPGREGSQIPAEAVAKYPAFPTGQGLTVNGRATWS